MKKLALVIVLAVVASKLLAVASDRPRTETVPTPVADLDLRINDRLVRIDDAPAPPATPGAIPSVPWRKGIRDRARRVAPAPAPAKAAAAGLRKPMPSWYPRSEFDEEARTRPDSAGVRVLIGQLSASDDRARQDLRKRLEREVGDWLAADVPPSWRPPAAMLDRMALGTYVQPVTRSFAPTKPEPADAADRSPSASPGAATVPDLPELDQVYTLYRAGQKLDFSPGRRAEFVETYRREVASWRMKRLGAGLVAVLACLLVITGYIRADEATKGYYTNRLRLAAAAGLGAAGVAAYQLMG